MKAILVILLLAVIGALATAGVMMLRKPGREDERRSGMAKALAWRVALYDAVAAQASEALELWDVRNAR